MQLSMTLSTIVKSVARREKQAATPSPLLPIDTAIVTLMQRLNSSGDGRVSAAECELELAARDAEIVSLRSQVTNRRFFFSLLPA